MNNRKPRFYYIIILILCFLPLVNLFLPYLSLPETIIRPDGYIIDLRTAALETDIVPDLAEELNVEETYIYRVGQTILRGRGIRPADQEVAERLSVKMDQKAQELGEIEDLRETEFSYFGIIRLAISVITRMNQNPYSAVFVIIYVLLSVILFVATGIRIIINKNKLNYKYVRNIAFANMLISLLGIICVNAIAVGALQVARYTIDYWGVANWIILLLSIVLWLVAIIARIHERNAGFVTWRIIARQKQLIFMTLPFVIYAIVFYYAPLAGWVTAFQNFKPTIGFADQAWVGWGKFEYLFSNREFLNVIRNTLAMSIINLALSFAFSIGFALLLNEVRFLRGKKFVQTVSYLPHFLSWVIVTGIVNDVLSRETGIVNQMLLKLGTIERPINFFAEPRYFWWIVGFSNVWKSTGWGSIIYLAAITAISPDLYEAASIDGAGRLKKMRHITLPGIRPTILILLIINIGNILNAGFEVQYLLGNGIVQSVSQTIDIYVLRYGISLFDFSLGTAAGIFKSVVSIILIFLANRFAKAAGEERLF